MHTLFTIFCAPFAEYSFMSQAMIACILLALSAPVLGIFLTLKRMSLAGDAMSHAILPGVAIGFAVAGPSVGAMTLGGFAAGSLVIVLSGLASRLTGKSEDSSLASFYLISLALGVLIVSTNGSGADLLGILFGSLLSVDENCLTLLAVVAAVTIASIVLIRRPLIIDCVDPGFLKSNGVNGSIFHIIFLVLTVLNLIAGFQAVGTLMSVGMLILPATIARLWAQSLIKCCLIGQVCVALACYSGLLLSYHLDWPTSPVIILTLGALYAVSLILGTNRGLIWKFLKLRHLDG